MCIWNTYRADAGCANWYALIRQYKLYRLYIKTYILRLRREFNDSCIYISVDCHVPSHPWLSTSRDLVAVVVVTGCPIICWPAGCPRCSQHVSIDGRSVQHVANGTLVIVLPFPLSYGFNLTCHFTVWFSELGSGSSESGPVVRPAVHL